jgi:hypothetical protein
MRFLPLAFSMLAVGVGAARLQASERWATLEAIHQLENPNNSRQPGRFGELGPYQFRPTTWQMHTSIPFERAHDRAASDAVAIKHYEYIRRELQEARLPVTVYNIALAWNSGISNVISGAAPRVAHNYAARAANLAAGLRARLAAEQAAAAPKAQPTTVAALSRPAARTLKFDFDIDPKPAVSITPAPRPAHMVVLAEKSNAPTVAFQVGAVPIDFSGRVNVSAFRGDMRVTSAD